MKLSIITVTYNSEKTLGRTIESVLCQGYPNIEYIIVDGASNDKTIDVIKSYEEKFKKKDISYVWISEPDKGIYDAFNKALKMSSGAWVSFLGADDYYLKNAVSIYAGEIEKRSDCDLIYSKVQIFNGERHLKLIDRKWSWKMFKKRMDIAHVGAFHNKLYFERHGYFDISYKIAGDYEVLLRAKDKLKAHHLDKLTAMMAFGGISNQNISLALKEAFRAKKNTAKISILSCILDYIVAVLIIKSKRLTTNLIVK